MMGMKAPDHPTSRSTDCKLLVVPSTQVDVNMILRYSQLKISMLPKESELGNVKADVVEIQSCSWNIVSHSC